MTEEPRVRDVWKTFPHRRVVGHALAARVGHRAWGRPSFAKFGRFFERVGLADPWDPSATEHPVGLGEVGIGQPRRAPAPHAAPPAAATPGAPRLPNIPGMPPPTAREPKEGRPAPQLGAQRPDDTADLKRKLAEAEKRKANPAVANAFKVNQPVAKIPMRPDLDTAKPTSRPSPYKGNTFAAPAVPRNVAPKPTDPGKPTRLVVQPTRPVLPRGPEVFEEEPGALFAPGARRPEEAGDAGAARSDAGVGGGAGPVAAPGPEGATPTARAGAAVPAAVTPPAAGPARSPAAPPEAPRASLAPPPSRPAARGGLDDMFGMGSGGENTRFRMPSRDEGAKPKRPVVTSEAELAAAGLDRRPPPAKPPTVTPTGGGGAAPDPEDDD